MKTIFITGSDTAIGKTWVTASLIRLLPQAGESVQLIKPVETGVKPGDTGDAALAASAGAPESLLDVHTFFRFSAPLAPLSAALEEGTSLDLERLVRRTLSLPFCDLRIVEGAGGIAVPLDSSGADWADYARQIHADHVILVVPDRLGAVNQCRLALEFARSRRLPIIVWLNECRQEVNSVRASNRKALEGLGLQRLCTQNYAEPLPEDPEAFRVWLENSSPKPAYEDQISRKPHLMPDPGNTGLLQKRLDSELEERRNAGTFRELRCHSAEANVVNLADNDYLELARDPAVVSAALRALEAWGCSSSASPLITGYGEAHQELERKLCGWHKMPHGLVWNSGFTANQALLSHLPVKGDLILADRLIHNSMISGILRSGARLIRHRHNDINHLQMLLEKEREKGEKASIFVVTESVYSMDGDSPDLQAIAALRERFAFIWMVDEAHATGWYGPGGSGRVHEYGLTGSVDIVVGTLGKALGAHGAYTLFQKSFLRDFLLNTAGEFIYSTYLSPVCAASASAAIDRCRELTEEQPLWRERSRLFREDLSQLGFLVPAGDSPIVPLRIGDPEATTRYAQLLRKNNILAGAIRPPAVPAGSSRLRFSLKRSLTTDDLKRVAEILVRSAPSSAARALVNRCSVIK